MFIALASTSNNGNKGVFPSLFNSLFKDKVNLFFFSQFFISAISSILYRLELLDSRTYEIYWWYGIVFGAIGGVRYISRPLLSDLLYSQNQLAKFRENFQANKLKRLKNDILIEKEKQRLSLIKNKTNGDINEQSD